VTTPFYSDNLATLYQGDVREVLAEMPDESVHCAITSPPYWGLRDYGTASWEGGDPECEHVQRIMHGTGRSTLRTDGRPHPGLHESDKTANQTIPYRDVCGKCGAVRIDNQLGLEPTPELYIEHMVEVFRAVRRVLRSDGTCWVNMGDCYATGAGSGREMGGKCFGKQNPVIDGASYPQNQPNRMRLEGLKPKDLVGMPWRLAFALQADGWWLRSEIIWAKPNPMPESVTDRPTKSHEYLFLLAKSAKYYYDAEAVRESTEGSDTHSHGHKLSPPIEDAGIGHIGWSRSTATILSARNKRSVWTIATEACPEAHFATFPRALVRPCILAGTSEKGVCPKCQAPWVRVVEKGARQPEPNRSPPKRLEPGQAGNVGAGNMGFRASKLSGQEMAEWRATHPDLTLGWRPSCACGEAEVIPATVLDFFAGSGTTLEVAKSLGRRGIGIELSADYCRIAVKARLKGQESLGL